MKLFDGDPQSSDKVCAMQQLWDAGYYVDENPVSVGSFHSSIAYAAGMEITQPAISPSGRPMSVGDGEQPILELFA